MARPRKQTVDYFPHYVTHGKTLFVLEQKYGIAGYAFWFKLLEVLCRTEGHSLPVKSPVDVVYLDAQTGATGKLEEILDTLSDLEAIDPKLWKKDRLIWSDNLVKNLSIVYEKRVSAMPLKPVSGEETIVSGEETIVSGEETGVSVSFRPESILEERKGKKRKEKNSPLTPQGAEEQKTFSYPSDFEAFWKAYPPGRKNKKGKALAAWKRAKGRPPIDEMVKILEKHKGRADWLKENGRFIPNPEAWLNGRCWEDEIPEPKFGEEGWLPSNEYCDWALGLTDERPER